jgi:hypothetical protein
MSISKTKNRTRKILDADLVVEILMPDLPPLTQLDAIIAGTDL